MTYERFPTSTLQHWLLMFYLVSMYQFSGLALLALELHKIFKHILPAETLQNLRP